MAQSAQSTNRATDRALATVTLSWDDAVLIRRLLPHDIAQMRRPDLKRACRNFVTRQAVAAPQKATVSIDLTDATRIRHRLLPRQLKRTRNWDPDLYAACQRLIDQVSVHMARIRDQLPAAQPNATNS